MSGLSSLRGSLTIRANYSVASPQRVDISYLDSALVRNAGSWVLGASGQEARGGGGGTNTTN
mgnify:CR=1 FL=1